MFEASPDIRRFRPVSAKEIVMRFAPVSAALSLALAVAASSSHSTPVEVLDPRAAVLEEAGRVALNAGDVDKATDAFEAALAIQPGSSRITISLAQAARMQGMQGKALHYYRTVLSRDPQNIDAMGGEGETLAEKGAVEKARENLAKIENLGGKGSDAANRLIAAIAKGPLPAALPSAKVASTADVAAKPTPQTN